MFLRKSRPRNHVKRVGLVYLSHSQRAIILENAERSARLVAPPIYVDEVFELVASVVDKGLGVFAQQVLHIEILAVIRPYTRHIVDTEWLGSAIVGSVVPLYLTTLNLEYLQACRSTCAIYLTEAIVSGTPPLTGDCRDRVFHNVW